MTRKVPELGFPRTNPRKIIEIDAFGCKKYYEENKFFAKDSPLFSALRNPEHTA
jgi:hypothetical protein